MKIVGWRRTLRTPSSERFLAVVAHGEQTAEAAAVDLHYLPNGHVSGTVILLDGFGWDDDDVPALLRSLDEELLPDVDLAHGTLTYTVVMGRVVAQYEAAERT
jgi:hypothetical protein